MFQTTRNTSQARPFILLGAAAVVYFVIAVHPASAQQTDASTNTTIPVACVVNGERVKDLPVTLTPSGELVGVNGPSLLSLLKDRADVSLMEELARLMLQGPTIATADLRGTGLAVGFNSQRLQLQITIPPKLQQVTGIRVTENKPPKSAVTVDPAAFSAQLSAVGQLDVSDQYVPAGPISPSSNSITVPFSLTLEPALNFHTWVLESQLSLNTASVAPITVPELRLVKDFPGPDIRLAAGDLSFPTLGFSSGIPVFGVGITRNFDLSPSKLVRPLGHFEFYLERPSQVRVLVNGQAVKFLDLQPGPYNLTDFPFTAGLNDVMLEIHDNKGAVERISRAFAYAQNLLLPGETSYSWNVGLPGRALGSPVLSGFQSFGVTNDLTVAGYAQADTINQIAGVESTYATPVGTVQVDLAGSHTQANNLDMGAFASYNFVDMSRSMLPSIGLTVQYRGRYFLGPETVLSQSPYQWIVRGSVSQALPRNLGLSVGLGYRMPWGGDPTYDGTAILTAPLGQGTSLSVTVGANVTPGSGPSWFGGVTLISSGGGSTTAVSENQSLTDPSAQIGLSYRPVELPGLSVDGVLSGLPIVSGQTTAGSATVNYRGNRFVASIGHSLSGGGGAAVSPITNHSFLRFGSALVYADGAFGITRPVSDDFAVFLPRPELGNAEVGVNRVAGRYEAQSGPLGNAVLSNIHSYTDSLARVDVPGAPMGYDLGNTLFLLSLPYRSGAVVHVGTNATVYVSGTLVDQNAKPIELMAGQLEPQNKEGTVQPFFTDRTGQFQAYGIVPGVYKLTLAAQGWAPTTISIPKSASGLYEVGTVMVSH